MAKGKKRAEALSKKRSAKAQKMSAPGGASRYALKKRGSIQAEDSGHGQYPVCARCYMRLCLCRTPLAPREEPDEPQDAGERT
jgi:hypothetical protein